MKRTPLTSMTAVEKKFIRSYVDDCLKPQGVNRKLWPELKADALDRFRRVQKSRCADMASRAVDEFVKTVCPVMIGEGEKK